jgi:hypothetical protein
MHRLVSMTLLLCVIAHIAGLTGECHHAQSLLRWGPANFFPLADGTVTQTQTVTLPPQ